MEGLFRLNVVIGEHGDSLADLVGRLIRPGPCSAPAAACCPDVLVAWLGLLPLLLWLALSGLHRTVCGSEACAGVLYGGLFLGRLLFHLPVSHAL